MTSAIQNLTPDVLFEIFSLCGPTDFSARLSCTAPFNLLKVCRSWRAVALERLSLWSSLNLSIFHGDCPDSQGGSCPHFIHTPLVCNQILQAWRHCIERSAKCPLNITLDLTVESLPTPIAEVVRTTFEEHHRWRKCYIDYMVNTDNPTITKLDFSFGCQPNLEILSLRIANGFRSYLEKPFLLDISASSRLAKMKIFFTNISISRPVGRMEHLTSLHLDEVNAEDLSEILRNAPSLSILMFGLSGDAEPFRGIEASMIHLNELKYFHVIIISKAINVLSHLVDVLCTPALVDLHFERLSRRELPQSNLWTGLKNLFQRSNPPLERLILHSRGDRRRLTVRLSENHSSDGPLISILEGLPGLKELQIWGAIASSRLLRALTRDQAEAGGSVLCPLLTEVIHEDNFDQIEIRSGNGYDGRALED
ncbi:hypothetical protein SCHPADRAFT_941771 [Schizopora paradoxa]|uniref:F-box domain-containing protein n=1 Tax=Schizopora paradoxa TaxID=27342 RepID=A0A0H2S491_9AGAM|nr:hypothetical protein SCHPADRAFT_941771 [Schizopora paradoxa]